MKTNMIRSIAEDHIKNHSVAIFAFNPKEIDKFKTVEQLAKRFSEVYRMTKSIYEEKVIDPIMRENIIDSIYEIINILCINYENAIELQKCMFDAIGAEDPPYDLLVGATIMSNVYDSFSDVTAWADVDLQIREEHSTFLVWAVYNLYLALCLLYKDEENIDIYKV